MENTLLWENGKEDRSEREKIRNKRFTFFEKFSSSIRRYFISIEWKIDEIDGAFFKIIPRRRKTNLLRKKKNTKKGELI